jgi:hypothetical protein
MPGYCRQCGKPLPHRQRGPLPSWSYIAILAPGWRAWMHSPRVCRPALPMRVRRSCRLEREDRAAEDLRTWLVVRMRHLKARRETAGLHPGGDRSSHPDN